jgi:hypothetical protein
LADASAGDDKQTDCPEQHNKPDEPNELNDTVGMARARSLNDWQDVYELCLNGLETTQ